MILKLRTAFRSGGNFLTRQEFNQRAIELVRAFFVWQMSNPGENDEFAIREILRQRLG
jgi:hypothetical protein